MQSRKWNFKNCKFKTYFLKVKWGRGWLTPSPSHPQDTMPEAKIPVKCLELRAGGLRGLILWGFFIPHWRLPYAQNPYSKAIGQLKTFPRERIWGFYIQKKNMSDFRLVLSTRWVVIFLPLSSRWILLWRRLKYYMSRIE